MNEQPKAPARRVEPTVSLIEGAEYVNAANTDIRARFLKMQMPPANLGPDSTLQQEYES